MSRILIACGGTGGHLAPGISIAEVLQKRGHHCTLLISRKQVDSALIAKYEYLHFLKTPGRAFSGGIVGRFAAIWSLLAGLFFSHRVVREEEPDMVLLFGGFLSVGLGLAAWLAGVPIAIHEANCKPGRAVRLLKRFASRAYLPEGVRISGVPPERVRYLGYPVRSDVKHCLKSEAWKRLGIKVPNKLLVVIGGSQGASALNDWVIQNFGSLAQAGIAVYCVTGLGKVSQGTIQQPARNGAEITATFVQFSDKMGEVLSAADLVVSRAGAGSIAEIIRCRAPAILVPYPYAADDHQTANALMHEQHGAGMMLLQDDIERLTSEVKALIFNDWMLSKFKTNLDRLDRLDSSQRIAEDIEDLCGTQAFKEAEKLERSV